MIPTPRSNWFGTDRTAFTFERNSRYERKWQKNGAYRRIKPVKT